MNEAKFGQLSVDGKKYDAIWVEIDGKPVAKLFYVEIDEETILTNRETDEEFRRQGLQKTISAALLRFMTEHNYRYIQSSIPIDNLASIANRLSLRVPGTKHVFETKVSERALNRLNEIAKSSQKRYPESIVFITDIKSVVPNNHSLWEKILDAQEYLSEKRYSYDNKNQTS
ncbi:N-acetyltransferase [Candidatus Woesebacteria bacterium]|nr:N-acetyltransferase [Candidatus Woesebacteria bacterium]MCD8507548.1 N-acetyltransferase [Candidatus Woesebacteria bacterium]MCD8527389.1 N-acetyltransferase [Candidatus Woesebacteria bacterium]MCD8546136.1 N-acetyltransferase [Candidatus Woesebacteria bacterium]